MVSAKKSRFLVASESPFAAARRRQNFNGRLREECLGYRLGYTFFTGRKLEWSLETVLS
jgi:hypothetical protein